MKSNHIDYSAGWSSCATNERMPGRVAEWAAKSRGLGPSEAIVHIRPGEPILACPELLVLMQKYAALIPGPDRPGQTGAVDEAKAAWSAMQSHREMHGCGPRDD